MSQHDLIDEISILERKIATLPEGNITRKRIRDKDYYYLRINKNGRRKETYISFEDLDLLKKDIELRRSLENKLKELKLSLSLDEIRIFSNSLYSFKTNVRIGSALKAQIQSSKKLKKRFCFSELRDYIYSDSDGKVLLLYGLRRTGKSTMMRQLIAEMSENDFQLTAYIQVSAGNSVSDVNSDLRLLESKGYRYIFIDEVTASDDFIETASLYADIYALSGMKIVLSGTDSLGFAIASQEQLYDRCHLLHTTYISYSEFEHILGIKGIDEYIRYGGFMSLSGQLYNADSDSSLSKQINEYIYTSIAKNIQHSLKCYEDGNHFRSLYELYDKGELTNVINRVIEQMNHSFTRRTVDQTFKSNDISLTARNLNKDRKYPIDINNNLNIERITEGIKIALEILDKDEQQITINDEHLNQIKEYLKILDIISEIDVEYLTAGKNRHKQVVISQPGIRFAQAEAIISSIADDESFYLFSAEERQIIISRLLSEISGRMMEEIVLLNTKLSKKDKYVFKLQFTVGEFDMVIADMKELTCDIYEVKHSTEAVDSQYRFLIDEEKSSATEFRFGKIRSRNVIYRGKTFTKNGINYINVDEYLKSL